LNKKLETENQKIWVEISEKERELTEKIKIVEKKNQELLLDNQRLQSLKTPTISPALEDELEEQIQHYQRLLTQACQDMTEIATSDGVLSANEEKVLGEKLKKYGFRIDSFQHFIKKNLENTTQETQIIDQSKQKGDDFEKLIAKKFDRRYFKLKSWAGDKYDNGVYAENTLHPDLIFEYNLKGQTGSFAVECKYRKKWYEKDAVEGIEWAKNGQLERYKKFSVEQQVPTFIVIGVGGEPNNPESVFVIPIEKTTENFLCKNFLLNFQKANFTTNNFGLNVEKSLIF